MYTRITTYRMNPDNYDAATALAEELKPEIMAIPGIRYWFSTSNEHGECAVIAVYDSREEAEEAFLIASALFAQFADLMDSRPQATGYDVILHGINS